MPRRLPKNVSSETTRHGKIVYYFRRGKGTRIRLPAIESPKFKDRYQAAIEGRLDDVRDLPITAVEQRKQRCEMALRACLRAARNRSRRKGLPFELTLDWTLDTARAQDFRCALTGIEFYAKRTWHRAGNPFAPSLDRIKPELGYTPGNVRIILSAVNTMLMDWGTDVFEQTARSYRSWQNEKGKSIPAPLILAPAPKIKPSEIS